MKPADEILARTIRLLDGARTYSQSSRNQDAITENITDLLALKDTLQPALLVIPPIVRRDPADAPAGMKLCACGERYVKDAS